MHNLESRNCKLTKLKKLEGFGGEQHSLGRTRGMASLSNAAVDRRIRQWRRLWGRRGRENVGGGDGRGSGGGGGSQPTRSGEKKLREIGFRFPFLTILPITSLSVRTLVAKVL